MRERMAVGVDIQDLSDFKNLDSKKNKKFFDKIFTKEEQKYCLSKNLSYQHFAARFCAKEAIIKAFSNFGMKLFFHEIEIFINQKKVPEARIRKRANKGYVVHISMAHSKTQAIAFAVVRKIGR